MKTIPMRVAAAVAAVLLLGAPSAAIAENVILHIWATDGENQASDTIEVPLDDLGFFDAEGTSITDLWEIDWGLAGDADPIVNSNFSVINTTGSLQDFNVTVTVPVFPPLPGATLTSGSLGVTVTDNNGDGATFSDRPGNSASIYRSIIDGGTHKTLFDEPYSLVAPAFGSNNDSADFGLPGITEPGPPTLTSIGIQIQFALTARDSAGITSTFTVVPEPASLALALLGAIGCLALGRRL
jgi:hypothetical protein